MIRREALRERRHSRTICQQLEIDMPDLASSSPVYFMISGFPKGGNKWLQKMTFDFASAGAYSNKPHLGIPLMARMFLDHEGLRHLLRRENLTMQAFTMRLVNRKSNVPFNLSDAGQRDMLAFLKELAVESAKIWPGKNPIDRFLHVIDPNHQPPFDDSRWRAFGMPCMHTPLPQLREQLPDFKVINILRDPRDVVVSFFYHLIATLTPQVAMHFVRSNPRTGELEQHPRWKKMFGNRALRRLTNYYGDKPLAGAQDHILRVRYEDLLVDAAGELDKTLRFLNIRQHETDARIAEIVEDRSFKKATGSTQEQRHRMIRKGQAGDWANYFDRELLEALGGRGGRFVQLVTELGYEHDDSWTNAVPEVSPKQFDFARFRIRRSTCRLFIKYWEQSPELQQRYPDSWDSYESEDSFFAWLENCGHADVQEWLTLARRLEELWHVDIVEKAGQ
jgi:hypothetical protein